MVLQVLGADRTAALERAGCLGGNVLNMTDLGLRCSHYINGVAMQHGEVSRGMFPNYSVRAIKNGNAQIQTCWPELRPRDPQRDGKKMNHLP